MVLIGQYDSPSSTAWRLPWAGVRTSAAVDVWRGRQERAIQCTKPGADAPRRRGADRERIDCLDELVGPEKGEDRSTWAGSASALKI
jgi:hypothetical protein